MAKIFIVSKTESEIALIQKRIEAFRDQLGPLSYHSGRPNFNENAIATDVDVLIYNTQTLDENARKFILLCRQLTENEPIIVLAKVPSGNIEFNSIKHLAVVRKPYEAKSLAGVLKNAIEKRDISHRRHPRFDVQENAIMDCYESEVSCPVMIENISKGGLLISGPLSHIKPGGLVRVRFNLNQINKERTMSARVQWMRATTPDNNHHLAGVQFVSQAEIYDYLLKYIQC